MSGVAYVINYRTRPSIERAARRTMADHLDREQGAWKPFLDMLASEHGEMQIPARHQAITGRQLVTPFDMLRAKLDDPDGFGRLTADSFRRTTGAPPPSGSTEGRLVLGLMRPDGQAMRQRHMPVSSYWSFQRAIRSIIQRRTSPSS